MRVFSAAYRLPALLLVGLLLLFARAGGEVYPGEAHPGVTAANDGGILSGKPDREGSIGEAHPGNRAVAARKTLPGNAEGYKASGRVISDEAVPMVFFNNPPELPVPALSGAAVGVQSRAPVYKSKKNASQKIALTFDDGPHPVYTPKILDILNEYGIKATFFIIGQNAEYYPDVLRRIEAEGHEIGNHTYYHRHLNGLSPERIKSDITLCGKAIYDICGYPTTLFRPPEGVLPDSIRGYAEAEDYKVILWSVDTHDWTHRPAAEIFTVVKSKITSGDIILMHDYVTRSPTPGALRLIIPYLLEGGYRFVTVSELLESE